MRFRESFNAFMSNRYGADQFGRFLSILALLLLIVNIFVPGLAGKIISVIVLLILAYCIFRMFSKNTIQRNKENVSFLKVKNWIVTRFVNLKRRFKDRKTHRYYKCPTCKTLVRVPKGKGKIRITCPRCSATFIKKT